eukprot:4884942-Amphidinium_carterae.1
MICSENVSVCRSNASNAITSSSMACLPRDLCTALLVLGVKDLCASLVGGLPSEFGLITCRLVV